MKKENNKKDMTSRDHSYGPVFIKLAKDTYQKES